MTEPDPDTLLALAVEIAQEAAATALRMRAEAIRAVATKTTRTDVVTAADREVERLVVSWLARARPGDTVLGEEFGASGVPRPGAVQWILDPIDGTVNYLYGLPPYAVSLAAERDGRVVCGVVHEIASGQRWTAVAGAGAYRDGRRLAGSAVTELSQALIGTGFGYAQDRRGYQGEVVAALLPEVRDIRRLGAASVDLCLAAEGRTDAYFEKGLQPWDLAAGGLIATEAGLLVSGLRGNPPGPDMVLAAPPAIHAELHDRLVALAADLGP